MLSKYVSAGVLACGLLAVSAEPARAQYWGTPYYNPYASQYQMQQMQMQSAYYYQMQQMQAANAASAAAMYNPMASSYGGGGMGYPGGGGAGYYPPYYPPYYSPYGSFLSGSADFIRAYGTYTNDIEKSYIMRESAEQAKLETRKKKFELNLYIRNNTPTYNEERAMAAKAMLQRVQTTTNPYEILNGAGLNLLIDDLKKFQGKRVTVEPLNIKGDILRQINITKSVGNLGLLRDDRLQWPGVLQDILGEDKQKKINTLAEVLVARARNGKIEDGVLKDLRDEIEKTRERLVKKVNEIPTQQYIDGKYFLKDLDDACRAVERGDAVAFFKFQDFVAKGKTAKEVSDYMIENGLRFAPAVKGGEAAYTAFHTAMVTLDIEVNSQFAGGAAPPPSSSSKNQ